MKRQLIVMTLVLIVVLPGLAAFAPPRQDQTDIELNISVGYNGYFRKGQWTSILVAASNAGEDFGGEIRVRTGGLSGLAETTYRTPVELPRGSRKQIFLYVSLEGFTQRVQVELVGDDSRVVERQNADIHIAARGDILYAVITGSTYGAVDLTGLTPGTGNAYQANWQIEDIPPLSDALMGLDVMMFHDVDTGTLTTEQIVAINEWVLSGGHLIVAGGDSWQRTTAGLQDMLPASLEGTVPVPSLAPLADYLRLPSDVLEQETTATRATPDASSRILAATEDVPLLIRGSYGEGTVDFLAVDPNTEPLRSWDQTERLWYTLVASTGQRPSWSRGFNNWSIGREATLTTSNTVLPTFFQLCGFLALYIVLVGPINYLVLRRLNRREWAWFTIPALIIGFSVLAYTVGFNLRGNVATINRLAVVRVWDPQERAHETSLIGVQSPRRGAYDVAVERGHTLRTLPESGIGLNVPTVITEGTRYVAEDVPIDAGMVASFVTSGFTMAPNLDASATWHLTANSTPRVVGRITNTTGMVLEDIVILVKGESRELGTLGPGESKNFNIPIGPQDPGPLTIGNPLNQYGLYSTGYYSSYAYTSYSSWCFTPPGLWLTIEDVMPDDEPFSCSAGGVTPQQQETRRRYRLLGALIYDTDVSGGRGSDVYLFAWTHQSPVEIDLPGKPQAEENTTLYIFKLTKEVVADAPLVEVPPSLTTWIVTETADPSTMLNATPFNFRIDNNAQAAFEFMPFPDVRLATVEQLDIKFQASGAVQLEVWNWEDRQWVRVNVNPDTANAHISRASPFVGPENAVRVRVTSTDNASYDQVDYVKVTYRGRFAE